MILDRIVATKREEVARLQEEGFPRAEKTRDIVSLADRLREGDRIHIISEVKRASPSKGVIRETVDPVEQAKAYERAGAVAISVLTDETYFHGSFNDLRAVAKAVDVPVLCKDFMIDRVQIDVAYEAGASIILLIVAALDDETLHDLYAYARSLDLNVLVEVHTPDEMTRALALRADVIGVNNRNLKTFTVDLDETVRVIEGAHPTYDPVFISESGIRTAEDVARLQSSGIEAILVGETLMRASSVEATIEALRLEKVR